MAAKLQRKMIFEAQAETIEAYCAIADRMGWGLGETLEKAVELLDHKYFR